MDAETGKGLDYYSLEGKIVKFVPEVDVNYELYADVGMLARVVSVVDDSHGDDKMVKIELDFNDFKDHNARFQKANFWDDNGQPTKTWYESGLYGNGRDTIICMTNTEKYLPPFVPVEDISETITVDECLDVLKELYTEFTNATVNGFEKESFNRVNGKAVKILTKAKRM